MAYRRQRLRSGRCPQLRPSQRTRTHHLRELVPGQQPGEPRHEWDAARRRSRLRTPTCRPQLVDPSQHLPSAAGRVAAGGDDHLQERLLTSIKAPCVTSSPSHRTRRRHRTHRPWHLQLPLRARSPALASPILHQNNQELAWECPEEQRAVDFIFSGPAAASAATLSAARLHITPFVRGRATKPQPRRKNRSCRNRPFSGGATMCLLPP